MTHSEAEALLARQHSLKASLGASRAHREQNNSANAGPDLIVDLSRGHDERS